MNYFYIVLIITTFIGVLSKQKFMDIILLFKIFSLAILANLWEENLISDTQGYVACILLYSLYMLLIGIKLPKDSNPEEEIDRV